MFENLGFVVAAGLGIVAFFVALSARHKSDSHADELSRLRRRIMDLERGQSPAVKPDKSRPQPPQAPAPVEPPLKQETLEPEPQFHVLEEPVHQAKADPQPESEVPPTTAPPSPVAREEIESPGMPETKAVSLEEKLGMHLFIWIGGISLLLAGIFLVKIAAERDMLSPSVRVVLGTIFGVAMLIVSEWMQRKSMRIAQALCGAGVAVLFACLLAAGSLHHLISLPIAFTLMAILTFLAVVLSLRHGPFVALLGLIGGFATPALISSGEPATGPTLIFLLLLEVGLTAVTRRRQWMSISLLTLIASLFWALFYAVWAFESADRLWISGFVLGSVIVYIVSAAHSFGDDRKTKMSPIGLAFAAITSGVLLLGLLVVRGEYSMIEYGMLAILGIGCLVLARLDRRYLAVPWLTGAVSAVMLLAWVIHVRRYDMEMRLVQYIGLTFAFGAIYTLGAYACLWRSERAVVWASLSAIAAVVYLLVARFGLEIYAHAYLPQWFAWWMAAGAGVVLLTALTIPVWLRRAIIPKGDTVLGILTLSGAAMWTLLVWWGTDPPWSATGWVAVAIGAALLIEYQRIPLLQCALVWLTGLAVASLIVPGPLAQSIGEPLVFNLLLPEYGLPALGFAIIAWRLHRAEEMLLTKVWQMLAVLTSWAMVTLLVRHGFESEIRSDTIQLLEWGTYAFAWSVMGFGVIALNGWLKQETLKQLGRFLGIVGLLAAIVGPVLFANPLWHADAVGTMPVLNWLLYLYALPAAMGIAWAWLARDDESISKLCAIAALVLCFVFVSMEVRQIFHGSILKSSDISNAEMYTYSTAWILFGGLLLLLGVVKQSMPLRYASLTVMLLSVAKVFAYDMRHLEDLYRVASFLGLGISLLLLGFIYQRFVFRRPRESRAEIGGMQP